jgi:hypothetical protein
MASLTTHLRSAGDHGRLAFHPECPVCCRERLVGAFPTEPLVSRRTQALLAAGVLALSTTTPTAVLAAEPDQEQEGAAAPEPAVNGDAGSDPDFDPGGDSTDLPFDAGPVPVAQSAPAAEDDESIALEQEPATNDDAPVADPGDGTSTPNAGQQQAPPATDAAPAPPAAEEPTPQPPLEPPSSAPAPEAPTAPLAPSETDAAARTQARERETTREKRSGTDATGPSQTEPAAPAPQPEPVYLPTRTSPQTTVQVALPQPASPPAAVSQVRGAQRGDRFHVVQRGESLWSIAKALLGDRASAARIAREVNRLWELNSDRIGTGDRDLLIVGTRLALR